MATTCRTVSCTPYVLSLEHTVCTVTVQIQYVYFEVNCTQVVYHNDMQTFQSILLILWQGVEDSTADLKQQLFQYIVNGTQNLFDVAHKDLEHLAKPKATQR